MMRMVDGNNKGSWNTGDRNTGHGNATNHCAGFFCTNEPHVLSFDVQTDLTRNEYLSAYPEAAALGKRLMQPEPIEFEAFKRIPGITPEKLFDLHVKHQSKRSEKTECKLKNYLNNVKKL